MRPPVPQTTITTTKTITPPNRKTNKNNKNITSSHKTKTRAKFLKSNLLAPIAVGLQCTISDKLSKRVSRGGGGGGGAERSGAAAEGEVKSSTTVVIATPPTTTSNADGAMAPAVTEPLSPAEKLVKSSSVSSVTPTVSSTPPPTTPTTRSNSRHNKSTDKSDLKVLATTSAASGTPSSKESKRNRTISSTSASTTPTPTPTTTTTRVTRSKDAAYQRVFEQAVTPSPMPVSSSTPNAQQSKETTTPQNNNNNEQMGLSVTVNNNNNISSSSNKDEANSGATNSATAAGESCNSTEQLLADLTNDFEEAITAEICLRKQLVDVDVDLGKSGGEGNVTTTTDAASKSPNNNALVTKLATESIGDQSTEAGSAQSAEAAPVSEQTTKPAKVETANVSSTNSAMPVQKLDVAGTHATRAQIISVEELPPISTDSTMTASEVEDNLEERLSQLDGTAVAPLRSDDVAAAAPSSAHIDDSLNITTVQQRQQSELPPSLSLETQPQSTHQQQPQQQQQFAQIQQLQLLSPTPTMAVGGMVHSSTRTPQSVTSANSSLAAICGSGSVVGDDLQEGEIEEVLKSLNFDPNAAGDSLGDLTSIFSDIVYSSLSYDDVSSSQHVTTAVAGGGVATSATASAVTVSAAAATRSPPPTPVTSPLKDVQAEIERQQQIMQRKIDFLVRRLRKVQARNMCRHTSEEVAGLFEWSARIANKRGGVATSGAGEMPAPQTPLPMSATPQVPIIAARPPAHNWADAQKSPVPSAQMSAVLRKLETSANAQQLCTTPSAAYAAPSSLTAAGAGYTQLKRSKKALAAAAQEAAAASTFSASTWAGVAPSGSGSVGSSARRGGAIVVPAFDANVAEEITHVAGLLQSSMREVQNAIDSDATESSSGGESADEMVTYNNQLQQSLSIAKRAAWRYSRDRAAIASRWSWLLSQIADLEIKIRQTSELHQEQIRTKGAVITCAADSVKSADAPSSSSNGVNGYKGDMLRNVTTEAALDDIEGSCRSRGFMVSQFRKRKLLQIMNIHNISKKVSRPSTIKCGCQWPTLPCGLCTGRLDPTSPRDLPDTMMKTDRVALLDGCYHPVLSFPEDVSNSIHFEAVARLPDFQQRIMRCQVKSIAKSVWRAEREAAAAAAGRHSASKRHSGGGGGESTTKRRYIKKKDRIAAEEKAAAATAGSSSSSVPHDGGALASSTAGAGNGTGTSTTPLVANRSTKKNSSRKLHQQQHSHLVGDGVLMEPLSPAATNHSSSQHSQSSSHHSHNYIHQTSETPLQNQHHFEQFNPNPIHSSLISNNNNNNNNPISSSKSSKHRKLSAASATNYHNSNNHYHNHQQQQHYNNQYYQQQSSSNGNGGDAHFLHTNDNWDAFATRSRTSSPTHGGNSNYHKYERTLDRKNRTSYDIDNIVIPYSVAAATRVEILPYKEIPTPKWRVIEDDNEATEENNSDDSSSNPNQSAEAAEMTKELPSNIRGAAETSADTIGKSATLTAAAVAVATKTTAEEPAKSNGISESETNIKTKNVSPAADNEKRNNISKSAAAEVEHRTNCEKITTLSAEKKLTKTTKHDENVTKEMKKELLIPAISAITKADEEQPKAVAMENNSATPAAVACSAASSVAASGNGIARNNVDNVVDHRSWSVAEEKQRLANDSYDSSADVDGGEEYEEEDISDEATILRHERALTEERRKFQTFLKFPWSTRSRANRRIDSRAESSGANTPDPASPAPNTPSVGGGDQESIPSPLAPSTPLNPLDSISEAGENALATANPLAAPQSTAATSASLFNCINNKRFERRRTTSTKKEREPTSERRSSTPDLKELIPPYEPLQFPLPDEIFNSLLQVMPSEYHQDESKYSEDCYTTITSTPFTFTNIKTIRHPHHPTSVRNNFKSNTATAATKQQLQRSNSKSGIASAITNNCDGVSNKNRKKTISSSSRGSGGNGGVAATTSDLLLLYEENGKEDIDATTVDGEEDDDDDDVDDDDEDYYPKHHLAPDDSIYDNCSVAGVGIGADGAENISAHHDHLNDEYGAYVGRRGRNMLEDSDGESSETEPFQDDDPNDPEWKGESEERSERVRKKF